MDEKNYSPTDLTSQAIHCFPWYLCVCDCVFLYFCNCLCHQHCTDAQKVRPCPLVSARLLPEKRRILRDCGGTALLPPSCWSGVQKRPNLPLFHPLSALSLKETILSGVKMDSERLRIFSKKNAPVHDIPRKKI